MRRWLIQKSGWRSVFVTAAALAAGAAQAEAPSRAILQQADLRPDHPQSATLGTVDLKPGDALPWHTHEGVEIGYVASGEVTLSIAGRPDRTYRAGQSFLVPRGLAHRSRAAGKAPTRLVVTWVTDTGTPLSTPAPQP